MRQDGSRQVHSDWSLLAVRISPLASWQLISSSGAAARGAFGRITVLSSSSIAASGDSAVAAMPPILTIVRLHHRYTGEDQVGQRGRTVALLAGGIGRHSRRTGDYAVAAFAVA